jgi:hypothetical protein
LAGFRTLPGRWGNESRLKSLLQVRGSCVASLIAERASGFCFASRRVTSFKRRGAEPQRSNQERLPLHPARLRRVPSLHRRSGGTARRAIHGPTRLSRHPCRSSPCATIPLGLLKGRCRRLTISVRFESRMRFRITLDSPARVTPLPPGEGRGRGMHPAAHCQSSALTQTFRAGMKSPPGNA